jgi:diguanylate cyclase (GGDEF)-like protein
VRDANEAALRLAPAGAALDSPLERWPRVGAALCRHLDSGGDGELVLDDPPAWYEVQRQALGDPLMPVGELLQLHDVSRRHRAHDEALRTLAVRQAELERATASQEELRDLALRDALTGLPNRRALQARHAELASAELTAQRPLSLVLIDLDHFKRVNDTYGHGVGDTVLREFAAHLAGGLRSGDLPHRIGGEEFALLVPGATPDVAARRLESIRAALAERPLAGMAEPVTFSAGVAGVGAATDRGLDSLLAEADGALYRAKREGRDRTVVAS